VKAAIFNAGYRMSGYHKEPQAIKTDAPDRVVWDIMRAWYKQREAEQKQNNPKKEPAEGSAAAKILSSEPSIEVDFTMPKVLLKKESDRKKGVARFPVNPEAHWGPKPKATGHKRKAESDKPGTDN